MKYRVLIIAFTCLVLQGCLSLNYPTSEYFSPSYFLRRIEGKQVEWFVLKKSKDLEHGGIGLRVLSYNTLIRYSDVYYLVSPGEKAIKILNLKDDKLYKNSILIPSALQGDLSLGKEIVDTTNNKKYLLRGCYINIDKIFSENQWCEFIVVDDCSVNAGFLFERGKHDFIGKNSQTNTCNKRFYKYYIALKSNSYKK